MALIRYPRKCQSCKHATVSTLFQRVKVGKAFRVLCIGCTLIETKWHMIDLEEMGVAGRWSLVMFLDTKEDTLPTITDWLSTKDICNMTDEAIRLCMKNMKGGVFLEFVPSDDDEKMAIRESNTTRETILQRIRNGLFDTLDDGGRKDFFHHSNKTIKEIRTAKSATPDVFREEILLACREIAQAFVAGPPQRAVYTNPEAPAKPTKRVEVTIAAAIATASAMF